MSLISKVRWLAIAGVLAAGLAIAQSERVLPASEPASMSGGMKAAPKAGPAPELAASAAALSQEVLLLREQIKVMKDYHSSLLDTVYWALAGVFGLAVLLSTFGWWSNHRVYEADKKRLKEELASDLKLSRESVEQTVQQALAKLTSDLVTAESRILNAVNQTVQTQFLSIDGKIEGVSSRLANEQIEIRREMAEARKLGAEQSAQLLAIDKRFDEYAAGRERQQNYLDIKIAEMEKELWELSKIDANVLLSVADSLEAACKLNEDHWILDKIKEIESLLRDRFIAANKSINTGTQIVVRKALDFVPERFEERSAMLRNLLESIKVED